MPNYPYCNVLIDTAGMLPSSMSMYAKMQTHIPKIDYKHPQASLQIAEALHQIGFAVLANHSIDMALIFDGYQEWQQFFDGEDKERYTFEAELQSGYFPLQSERAKGFDKADLKEFFHLYSWSTLPQGMSDRTWQLFTSLVKLAEELLGWIELAAPSALSHLAVPLSQTIADSQATVLRILHYPPLTGQENEGAVRAAAHEDINLITLLPASTAAGLEIQDNLGNWYAVPSYMGDIVVNVGDMLQLASHGYYRSTTHRVIDPEGTEARQSRYSMPLFLHPRSETFLAGSKTARTYLEERLREIGLLQ